MNQNPWMNDPSLANINPEKLLLLQSFMNQNTNGKSPNDMFRILMAASTASKKKGLRFTPEEMNQIISVMKIGKSPQELAKIDQMFQMIQMFSK